MQISFEKLPNSRIWGLPVPNSRARGRPARDYATASHLCGLYGWCGPRPPPPTSAHPQVGSVTSWFCQQHPLPSRLSASRHGLSAWPLGSLRTGHACLWNLIFLHGPSMASVAAVGLGTASRKWYFCICFVDGFSWIRLGGGGRESARGTANPREGRESARPARESALGCASARPNRETAPRRGAVARRADPRTGRRSVRPACGSALGCGSVRSPYGSAPVCGSVISPRELTPSCVAAHHSTNAWKDRAN